MAARVFSLRRWLSGKPKVHHSGRFICPVPGDVEPDLQELMKEYRVYHQFLKRRLAAVERAIQDNDFSFTAWRTAVQMRDATLQKVHEIEGKIFRGEYRKSFQKKIRYLMSRL